MLSSLNTFLGVDQTERWQWRAGAAGVTNWVHSLSVIGQFQDPGWALVFLFFGGFLICKVKHSWPLEPAFKIPSLAHRKVSVLVIGSFLADLTAIPPPPPPPYAHLDVCIFNERESTSRGDRDIPTWAFNWKTQKLQCRGLSLGTWVCSSV